MDWNNLVSGLIGAVIGAVVTTGWLWWERRQRLRGACRAIRIEVERNQAIMVELLAGRPGEGWPLKVSAFEQLLPDIAGLLSELDLWQVSQAYAAIDDAERIRTVIPSRELTADERDRLKTLWEHTTAANDILKSKGEERRFFSRRA